MVPHASPVRRVVLERAARPLLARFLAVFAPDFCAAHAIDLGAFAASDPHDRGAVHALLARIEAGAPPLSEAEAQSFARLDVLACPRGGEQLIALDSARLLPRAKLGDEDLALAALLDAPGLAATARALLPSSLDAGVDSFTEYDPADARPVRFGEAERRALEATLAPELEARDRTRYVSVRLVPHSRSVALEIEYGRRPRTRDRLDSDALAVAPSTDIHTERAFAEIDRASGRLAVHAPHVAIKALLCGAIGKVVASDPAFFTAARVYDLSPFRDLDAALSAAGVERLLSVALHALTVRTPAGSEVDVSRPRRDLRGDEALAIVLREATRIGAPVAVRLYLGILDRRAPVRVELVAKEGRNRLDFVRRDPDVCAVVRGYLRARGVLRELPQGESQHAITA